MGRPLKSYLCGGTLLNMSVYGNFCGNLYRKREGGYQGYRKGVPSRVQGAIGRPIQTKLCEGLDVAQLQFITSCL